MLIRLDLLTWFAQRELNSWNWMKELTEVELDQRLLALDPRPKFLIPPTREQKIMFLIAMEQPHFLFFAGLGVGKSGLALYIIDYLQILDNKPALVFVPSENLIYNWLVECKKFVPHRKIIPITGSKEKRQKLINKPGDIYILTYDSLRPLFSTGKYTCIDPKDIKQFAQRFQIVVYDEVTELKHTQSIAFQVCRVLSKNIDFRYGLTGRPFGRQTLDIWAQFYCVDLGSTLGRNINLFKQTFFKAKRTRWGIEWEADDDKKELFHKTIQHKSIYFPEVPLPPPIRTRISVELSPEAKVYYRKLRGDVAADRNVDSWKAKIKNSLVKFRQICSGYLKVDTKELDLKTGKEVTVDSEEIHFENSKEAWLDKIVSSIPESKKLIIFYVFTPSGQTITNRLNKLKIKHVWLWGGTKSKASVLSEFEGDPACRVLVANIASGSPGLNLQHACYSMFYELPDNVFDMAQALGRTWRRGQTEQVYVYELVIRHSIEERLVEFINEGQHLFDQIIKGHITPEQQKQVSQSFLNTLKSKLQVLNAIGSVDSD